jgi:hypothetical protein
MAELNEDSVLGALEGAFSNNAPKTAPATAPKSVPAAVPEAAPDPEPEAVEAEAGEPVEGEDEASAKPEEVAAEPEFEVEVDGVKQVVHGKEKVTELLQKGLHYSQRAEANARTAEILAAQSQQLQTQAMAQQALMGDITELQTFDKQIDAYKNIDWAAAFDSDPFGALKLKEQRDQLREARAAKFNEFQHKRQQIDAMQAQNSAHVLNAEQNALLAKLPEWRNSDQAEKEKAGIKKILKDVGFQEWEIVSAVDHRAIVIARLAMKYLELQAGKAEKVKQVRDAPQLAKPGATGTQQPNEKANFTKFQQEFRAQGRKGNHYAQEASLLKTLNRVFK